MLSCVWPAGSYGRQLLEDGGEGLKLQPWQIALGIAFTVGALAYIGRIAADVRPSFLTSDRYSGLPWSCNLWPSHCTLCQGHESLVRRPNFLGSGLP